MLKMSEITSCLSFVFCFFFNFLFIYLFMAVLGLRCGMGDLYLKSLLNLLQCCFCFIFCFFWPGGMWGLTPTRDQTHTPCIRRQSLNHWTTREVPHGILNCRMHSGSNSLSRDWTRAPCTTREVPSYVFFKKFL